MLATLLVLAGCTPLSPLQHGDGGTGGGSGGTGGGGGGVSFFDAGWPVTEVAASGFSFVELDAFDSNDPGSLAVWRGQLYGASATGLLVVRDGTQWKTLNTLVGAASDHLVPSPEGPLVYAFGAQRICGAACRDGGASVDLTTQSGVNIACGGYSAPRMQVALGAVGELTDAGWVALGGSIGDVSDPYSSCFTTRSGRLLFPGPRIRELRDGGFRNVSPTFGDLVWTDFAEPSFGVVAMGAAQALAVADGGAWEVVAQRGGLAADPWVRALALPDGSLGLVGYEAFSLVRAPGHIESVRWPLGSLRALQQGITVDDEGRVWVSGTWTLGEDSQLRVVGVKAN